MWQQSPGCTHRTKNYIKYLVGVFSTICCPILVRIRRFVSSFKGPALSGFSSPDLRILPVLLFLRLKTRHTLFFLSDSCQIQIVIGWSCVLRVSCLLSLFNHARCHHRTSSMHLKRQCVQRISPDQDAVFLPEKYQIGWVE
jgi:hypothetical protein